MHVWQNINPSDVDSMHSHKHATVASGDEQTAPQSQDAQYRKMSVGAQAVGVQAIGANAVGALAVAAIAVGAVAVGAVAIGRLVIGRAKIRRLEIDDLIVRRLQVIEESTSEREDS